MKDIQDTSREAYKSILPNIGKKQQIVYDTIKKLNRNQYSPFFPSVAEIANVLGVDSRVVAPRVNELMHMGMVIEAGKKKCTITKKMVKMWIV